MIDNLYPLLKILFPKLTWKRKTSEKVIYLTFDDGPIPDLTEFILDELKKYNQKATFFCVGENITKHPHLFQRILHEGHKTGNHTYNHLKGWKTTTTDYLQNIQRWEEEYSKNTSGKHNESDSGKKLFRPPYGRVKRSQLKPLLHEYEIIMWNVLTQDYNQKLSPDTVLKKAIKGTSPGAIVVFHDNLKASENIRYALPAYLQYLQQNQFQSHTL